MSSTQTEQLKYGIGIVADYSSLGLGSRIFEEDSVKLDVGTKKTARIENQDVGITNHGLFSYIVANVRDHIDIVIDIDTEVFALPIVATGKTAGAYIRITVKKGIQATVYEQITSLDLTAVIIDVVLEEGAHVTYIADQRVADDASVLALRRGFVAKDASLSWIDLMIGGRIAHSSIYTLLDDTGARGETYGIFFGTSQQFFDIAHTMVHRAPHTSSDMKTHGALDGQAKAIYRSLIDIRAEAHHADGHQKEDTLLLSRDAQISAVPDLNIENNEVACSHGVSTTNIDDDSLFYFHSRGMGTEVAKQAIVEGHVGVIVDMIPDETRRCAIMDTIGAARSI